jgi:curved DNA-binding protein CbpA
LEILERGWTCFDLLWFSPSWVSWQPRPIGLDIATAAVPRECRDHVQLTRIREGIEMNFYEVLRIPIEADAEMIRTAFRRLARQYHPDTGDGSSSERFREVAEAYETLADPVRRRAYNQVLFRSATQIPVRVERVHIRAEPLRTPRAPFNSFASSRATSEFTHVIDQLFSSFMEDSFFDWPRVRR